MQVSGAATTSCLKRWLYNILPNVTYSPTHLRDGTLNDKHPVKTSHCFHLFKNVALTVLFGNIGNAYILSDRLCGLVVRVSGYRFSALPDFLSGIGSGTGSTQPRESREVN